ncbi:MAG: monovalent cation/H(+) antiporter subunit G [Phototrophicaceae bacterium]|jgi:multicomponent Na+:H+ antiporter subunit G
MLRMILDGIALFWLIFGLTFCIIGVIGVLRLPEAYLRLHASGEVSTMGIFGLLLAVAFATPSIWPKLLILGVAIAISSPVVCHSIAKADKDYSTRQLRDSSISAAGSQPDVISTHEFQGDENPDFS